MTDRVCKVLVHCTGASARSIRAESILQRDEVGRPITAQWDISYPVAIKGTRRQKEAAFVAAFRALRNLIGVFMALQGRLRDMGQTGRAGAA